MSVRAILIIAQRKAFYRQRIPESSCAWKEIVDTKILVTSRNGNKKIKIATKIAKLIQSLLTTVQLL